MTDPVSYYERHIFFCLNERKNGEECCAQHAAQEPLAQRVAVVTVVRGALGLWFGAHGGFLGGELRRQGLLGARVWLAV